MSQQNILRSLEMTFGKIPVLIKQNVKYLLYDDSSDDFTCVPCDKIIKKSSTAENTTVNFEKHLLSNAHKSNTTTDDQLNMNLNITFAGTIPPIVLMNCHMLSMNGNDYECVLCEKIIKVSIRDLSATENNFSYHLLSYGHERKLEDYNETLSQLYEIYGGIPRIILNHSRFLIRNGKHYLCTICDKQLQVHPSDVDETEKCFEKHLHSLKHVKNAKQSKAFSITPELRQIFSALPNYMLRNIDYITINGPNFFCSLCNENIRFNKTSPYETELNFKQHISSSTHEENLNSRKDPENKVFNRLCDIFEDFPDVVQDNIKYLTIDGDDFYCEICAETITEYDDDEHTKDSLDWHFQSSGHINMVSSKDLQLTETLADLAEVFGAIPEIIQGNLKFIEHKSGKNFECTLCNKIMKAKFDADYERNTTVTESNFEQHLESNQHINELDEDENIGDDVMTSLKEIFGVIPQFIMTNFEHLTYADDSDNFECILCEKEIAVVPGSKKAELTEQNFRNHFLSVGHVAKLKNKANLLMKASDQLGSVFGKIPDFIMSNIQNIEIEGNHYRCTICNANIMRGGSESTERKFREHFFGSRHRSESEAFENENDEAFCRLDKLFWRVPEFMLRNIDFLCTFDDDLFCILCQETLAINEEDLVETKQSLRCHMDSERHQFSLRNL